MATINEIIQSAVDRVKLKGSETWIKWSFWTRAKDVELNSGKNVETAVSELDENISNEIDRATDRENEIETALNSEITRAKSAESTLSTSINNEITRAKNAESTLETNKVPITRTINGKALSSNITLSASDVGADASGSANTALTNAKAYTDTKVADLVNSAPETLDTLGEIADALKDNADIVDVLNESIATKANASDLISHTGNTTVHITSTERTNWNDANSKKHTHSNKTVLDNTTASYTTADKTKLDGIATSAEVNQNAFSNVVIGSTTIAADSKTDSLTLAGSNVTLTPDATNDKVTIGITKANVVSALGYTPPTTNTTYGVATSSALGLVKSGTDITVDSSGNVSVNDDSHNHTIGNVDNLQTTLDAKASKYGWIATIKGQTWSRIFQVRTSIPVIGTSGILNVSFTRARVVANATFMIVTSHKNKCNITQVNSSGLSSFKIRGVADTNGFAYIELYDYAGGITADTEQKVYCEFIPLRVNTVNVYKEFTDGTTVPDGYTANNPLSVEIVTGGSMVASKFVGDLVGNSDTATTLATARTINDTDFDGSADIRTKTSYNLKFGQQYANNGQYRIFAKLPKVNTTGNQGCTLLVTDVADCGRTHNGAWIVQCTNRGTTPTATMQVRSLLANHSDVKFGYYSDDDYFYFGLMNPAYSAGTFITVLSKRENNNSEDKTTIGCLSITPDKPSDWTVVETKYTPQPSASDTVAGIMKLYTGTGSNADGTMTQSAITTELGKYLPLAGGSVSGNIIPSTTNNSLILGSSTNRWGTVYTNNHDANYIYLRKYMVLQEAPATPKIINYATYSQTVYSSSSANAETSTSTVELGGGQTYFYGTYHNLDTVLKGYRLRLNADSKMSTNVALAIASDEKVKSFTTDIDTDEEKLVKLFDIIKPKSYNYKYLKSDNLNGLNIGFSAQEIEQAMIDLDIDPEKYGILNIQYGHMLSRGNDFEDGKYYTKFYEISYNDLFNLSLLKTHMMEKEHVERLVALEEKASKLDELEARLSALENK